MIKKSFTLFEVLVSLVVLLILLKILVKVFTVDEGLATYYQLQTMENQYNESLIIHNSDKIEFQLN